jgi:hypothetical protein
MTQHFKDTAFGISEKGEYSVEAILPGGGPKVGVNKIDIIIHNKEDKDVAGADLIVTPWMPSMNHGVKEKPVIRERGGGLYAISNVVFNMMGDWELRINILKGETADKVYLKLPDIKAMGHTHSMTAPDASKIDTTSEKMSGNEIFHVSLSSKKDPVPINRIHSWTLKVTTPDGKPVKKASIMFDADMPEHGHGLPTEPEITEKRKGRYEIEGVKFTMPGWWVFNLYIMAGKEVDHVSFNVIVQ